MENDKQIIKYQSSDGKVYIDVSLTNDTVWLSLNDIVMLFGRDKSVISRHIGNIYKEGELSKEATVANYATVQKEGSREINRSIEYYNLDVIISVGYRVKSKTGTNFRIWATNILRKKIIDNANRASKDSNVEDKYNQIKQYNNTAA